MSKQTLVILTIIAVAAAVATGVIYKGLGNEGPALETKKTQPTNKSPNAPMTDAERRAYIKKHVTVSDLAVSPDTHIRADGTTMEVKGLLRVSGVVKNAGDKTINKVVLVLHTQDDTDKVLGTDIQDVLSGGELAKSENRKFSFTVRDRKGFTNRFKHSLR